MTELKIEIYQFSIKLDHKNVIGWSTFFSRIPMVFTFIKVWKSWDFSFSNVRCNFQDYILDLSLWDGIIIFRIIL